MAALDWGVVRAVVGKDLLAVRRSKAVMLPMLLVPALLLVVLPALVGWAARSSAPDVQGFLNGVPGDLAEPILRLPKREQLVVLVNGYLLAPLFLIVPLMVSSVLAADAFAGEKERRTMETLLHLPVSERDLLIRFAPERPPTPEEYRAKSMRAYLAHGGGVSLAAKPRPPEPSHE